MANSELVYLDGISMYAHLRRPRISADPRFSDRYTIDLLLDQKNLAKAQKAGLRIRDGNTKYMEFIEQNGLVEQGYTGQFITADKDALRKKYENDAPVLKSDEQGRPMFKDGQPVFEMEEAGPPNVRDSLNNQIPVTEIPLVGNGSKVTAVVSAKSGGAKPKGEWGARLIGVTILDLVRVELSQRSSGSYVASASDAPSEEDDVPAFARA